MMNMDYEYSSQRRNPAISNSQPNHRKKPGKGGRYLKQPPKKTQSHSRYGSRRHRRRRLNPRFVILMVGLASILLGIILCFRSCSRPTIVGRWDLDGTTVYEFEKDGTGALVLLTIEYEFSYVVEDNILRIDFVDEGALDANYAFQIEKDVLFLTGGPGDAKTDFALTRKG